MSVRYMWYETNLQLTGSIDDTGEFVPAITGCWFVGWVLTYLCLFKVLHHLVFTFSFSFAFSLVSISVNYHVHVIV